MHAEMSSDEFIRTARNFGGLASECDLGLTVARMLAAARWCPAAQGEVPGFLDQTRELTKADWTAMIRLLANRWRAEAAPGDNPFDAPRESDLSIPGELEQLRKLILGCLRSNEAPSLPPLWLLQSTLNLSRADGLSMGNIDPDVQQLVVDALSATPKTRIFCAYDGSIDIALRLAVGGSDVTLNLTSRNNAALCACLAIAADLRLRVELGDPLEIARSDFRSAPLVQNRYDASVVFPPFGIRYSPTDADTFGTKLPVPTGIEAAGLALALARGSKVAACLLPPSFLFRAAKAEQAFKECAITEYGLDTIVGLPRGTFGASSIAGALILCHLGADKHLGQPRDVFMMDARRERVGIGQNVELPESLAELIRTRTPSALSVLVPVAELSANDFNLSVERYVLNPEALRMRERAAGSKMVTLDDLVEFYRPQAVPVQKDTTAAYDIMAEVGAADIDEVGLVRSATKQIAVAPEVALQVRRARLEPGDIILVIKGSIGKVGYVREVPETPPWLASQSFVILRLRRHGLMTDPRVLFRFLSSRMAQTTIQSLRSGVGVPGLQMADVRRLAVIVPSLEEQAAIAQDVDGLFGLQDQIRGLRTKLADRQARIWPDDGIEDGQP